MQETSYTKPLHTCTIAIAGLGLMGGSLGLALRGKVARVVGIARRPETLEQALAAGAIDEGYAILEAGAAEADVVVLATPVSVILQQLAEIGRLAELGQVKPGVVVLDMGSTKQRIWQAMQCLPPGVEPVGGHPMCGKESSGLEVAERDLYRDAPFVISPLPRTAPQATALATSLALAVDARPIQLDPARHDRLAAAISHLPYVLSVALFATADGVSRDDPLVWELAAGGFRSATRLAGSDDKMMSDILLTNSDAVLEMIDAFRANLADLAQLIREGNEENLRAVGATVRSLRANFLRAYGE